MDADQKVIQLLRACRAEELPGLRRFAASPYVNRQPAVAPLLELLLAHWPLFEAPLPGKAEVYETLFPGEPFDDKSWRYLLSSACALIEDFWVDVRLRGQLRERLNHRLSALASHGVDKAYRHALRQAEEAMQEAPFRDAFFFLDTYRLYDQQHRFFAQKRLRQHDETLQQASEYLDRFYFLEKLRYACAMLERQHILQGAFQAGIGTAWLQHLEEQDFFGEPLIRLYHLALQMQQDEEDENRYRALRSALLHPTHPYPPDDRQAVYQLAINYCARKIRQGTDRYTEEALSLYAAGIRSGVLLDKGRLSPWTFTNVVKLALRLRRFDWLREFMDQNSHLLPDEHREHVLHFNLAELYFYTNRLREAQMELLKVEMTDLNYYLGARVLLAKIYAETGEEEALLSLLAAFTVFLKRNKEISGELKQTYLNFCRLLWQLVRAIPGKTHGMIESIQHTQPLTDRAWLLEQATKSRR
ncbi:MAG: hypothetical protein SFV52_05025 [Saprospiraceae bacterium]|nr:hypothetical protein [Saprospiraceae bacterium]